MSTQYSSGIQTLLEAEKQASDIVNNAKKNKIERIKEAKVKAEKELEEFRIEREHDFETWKKTHAGNTEDANMKLETETEQKLKDLEAHVASTRESVIQLLLDGVADVHPELHENLRFELSEKKKIVSERH